MTIEVLLFAQPREIAGCERVAIEVPPGKTYGDLRRQLSERNSALATIVEVSRLAAGGEFVDDGDPIREGEEIALVPPVSGG